MFLLVTHLMDKLECKIHYGINMKEIAYKSAKICLNERKKNPENYGKSKE